MPTNVFASNGSSVNVIAKNLRKDLEVLMTSADLDNPDERLLERSAAELGTRVGAKAMRVLLEEACRRATMVDLAERGLTADEVRWRREPEYFTTVRTTLGEVRVWTWAYRHRNAAGGWTTRVPARGKVVAQRRTRSSTVALEWECKAGAMHPYRQGAELLPLFSHGKLTVEDNTMARHVVAIGLSIKRSWKYRTPADIAEVLATRATRDAKTGRPLMYFSCDAHTIRQYVNDTWAAQWKNINGVRLWCQDRKTGGIIHLGGDFTVGDCEEVVRLVEELGALGILPTDLTYRCAAGEGGEARRVTALLVVVTDGAKWLYGRLAQALPDAVWLLDAYHAFEYLGEYTATLYGKGTRATKEHYATLITTLTGQAPSNRRPRCHARSWRRKRPNKRRPVDYHQLIAAGFGIDTLIDYLEGYTVDAQHTGMHQAFVEKLRGLRARMDYLGARARGMQIGSGAMESLHRTGSQLRLKLPGARWRPEVAQALLNLRCLGLAGRWDEFWSHDDLPQLLNSALGEHQSRVRRAA